MAQIFRDKWTSTEGDAPTELWVIKLAEIGDAGIQRGLAAVGRMRPNQRGEIWPPNMVEFQAMCAITAESLGLPTADSAFGAIKLAAMNYSRGYEFKFAHSAIEHTFAQLGGADFMATRSEHQWGVFERAWTAIVNALLAGDQLSQIPLALPKPQDVRRPANPQLVQRSLAEARAALQRAPDRELRRSEPVTAFNDVDQAALLDREARSIADEIDRGVGNV